ncbi:hypothetical protein [Duganella sp. P38]|uniref:hypothetical protein n=1 Tax=Duganella sp. P38 TaxID=3423949 RepID=UPI003D793266
MLLARRPLVLGALLAALPAAATAGWQDLPDSLALAPLGDAMVVNGVPMQMRRFNTTLQAEALLQQVQDSWERGHVRGSVSRSQVAGWTVLNQTLGPEHRSFQVRQAGAGLEGMVALTSPQLRREPSLAVPLPAAMTAVSVIDSTDQGKQSQQVIAFSSRSVEASAQALEAALRARGWTRHTLQKSADGVLLAANRGEQQFDATVSAQRDGAMLMMNTLIRKR